ncbi:uncharacterized protein [Typha angustifolia]|uniref:uncharacterized protein n=1 Tax=Typha angustifolia TaxID=59011 RepID=UPI003C2F73E4
MADIDRTNRKDIRSYAEFDRGHHSGLRAGGDDYDRGYRNEFRSYSGGDRKLEIVKGNVFSANQMYVTTRPRSPEPQYPPRRRSAGTSGAWCFSDPEMKRRRRVASYKVYSVEGKVKSSLKKGFRWIKVKCSEIIHGW